MKINLGFDPDEMYGGVSPAMDHEEGKKTKKEPRVMYPEVSVRGKAAEKLAKQDVDAGDTITAMVTFKVTTAQKRVEGKSSHSYRPEPGTSLDMEILSMDDVKIKGEEPNDNEDEESASEALDGYLSEKGIKSKK